jgi:hypothetical protein
VDLPVALVGNLKHAGVNGKKLTWDLQVNASAVSVKLIWIKAKKPVAKTGEIASQAHKKKYLSFHQETKCSTHQPVEGEKGMKPLVTIKYTLKHRQTIVTPTY